MSSHLGKYFKEKRLAVGLTLGKLAGMMGYRNINRGCRRIRQVEEDSGYCKHEKLLSKLAAVLKIDDETIIGLIEEDVDAYKQWEKANPVDPHLVVRYMAAVYGRCKLPKNITTLEDSRKFASDKAVEMRFSVCLVWSHRLSIYYDQHGHEGGWSEKQPYMSYKGKRFLLNTVT
jgi:hypothetical protein